ncbi:MAG: ATP-binding protein [Bacteroidota bacterium]|nr:ATP-binding protein [Bacteroidota bacterium]
MLNPLLKRIAIIGPESTGKSTLAQQLADYYNTTWVPEYAREYLAKIDREYDYEDVLKIAQGQLGNENRLALFAENYLFVDTELIINKVWCEFKWHTCHQWILDRLMDHHYDLYLLTYFDLPWQYDPLRENPHIREELFEIYRNQLEIYGANYRIVKGIGEERLLNARSLIESALG